MQCVKIDHDESSAVTHLIANLINAVGARMPLRLGNTVIVDGLLFNEASVFGAAQLLQQTYQAHGQRISN